MLAIILIARLDGWPDWRARLGWRRASRQGTVYAIGRFVGSSYLEVDKVLMLQILGAVMVGSYTVGFRVLSVLAVPVYALVTPTIPRLMALHELRGPGKPNRAIFLTALAYGVFARLLAFFVAPCVPA